MIDEKLIQKLGEYIDTERVQKLVDEIDEQNNTEQIVPRLDELQSINNAAYNTYGFNRDILDFQVYINQLRNRYDIPDKREIITKEGGRKFVQ